MTRHGARRRSSRAALTAPLLALLVSSPVHAEPLEGPVARIARDAEVGTPVMRLGLAPGDSVRIGRDGDRFRLVDPVSGREAWEGVVDHELAVVPTRPPVEGPRVRYRVQIGAYRSENAAEEDRARVEAEFGAPAVVRFDPDRSTWRVRVGDAFDRDALGGLIDRLRAAGREGAWITEEPVESAEGVALRLVDTRTYRDVDTGLDRVVALPVGPSFLRIDGVRYRGIVELRLAPDGRVRPINWVGLERYLLGVVPAELGPEVWPEIEALKAQSIAARTYAWKNRGQFEAEGFDLCATPRCQVYKGRDAEHPMSTRAVDATRGEVLTWEGAPVDALYTATCGGHTENVENVFVEGSAPYLRGVPCRAEGAALRSQRGEIVGGVPETIIDETGRNVTRDWALLVAIGVADADATSWSATVRGDDIDGWARALARVTGNRAPVVDTADPVDLAAAASALIDAVGWRDRANVLIEEQDFEPLVRDASLERASLADRRAIAYLMRVGALGPDPSGDLRLGVAPSRARLVPALASVAETYEAFDLELATVSRVSNGTLRVARGKSSIALRWNERPFLFAANGGVVSARRSIELWPGDRVVYRRDGRGRVDFLELVPPIKGISDDRTAAVYSWDERLTRRQVEDRMNRRIDVGTLRDLQIIRRGVSGRIAELQVVGSRGRHVVRGFDIRRLLGLRESLVVFEMQRDPSGTIRAVTFSGKGWGHGVGMCQVGAYGMALRGKTYREILAHYYRGARLERIAVRR